VTSATQGCHVELMFLIKLWKVCSLDWAKNLPRSPRHSVVGVVFENSRGDTLLPVCQEIQDGSFRACSAKLYVEVARARVAL